jgi:hypothetical protein
MAKSRNYTDEEFIQAVESSRSIAQALSKLGLKPAGGNYSCAQRRMETLGVNLAPGSNSQGWAKGLKVGPKRPIEDYLSNLHPIGSNSLRKRLIREGLKESKCECCGITEWNGKAAPLELDHIDGNHHDNRLENLQILCPNCHAQTETYRGKNRRKVNPIGDGTALEKR